MASFKPYSLRINLHLRISSLTQSKYITPARCLRFLGSQRSIPSKPSSISKTLASPVDYEAIPQNERELRLSKPPLLVRPIGWQTPPQPGDNKGTDERSWSQRRSDFLDYDKYLEKRKRLANELFTPYFRDFSRLSKQFKGKSWIAPSLLFRADKSLYLPNMTGRTISRSEPASTSTTLFGNVSVVCVYSSTWAERQTKSFVETVFNNMNALNDGRAQLVEINVEQNWLKSLLIKLFLPRLRKLVPIQRHNQYFIVTKGLSDSIKHSMGYWNSKVGYVYLIDWNCRIRWAGSGNAEPDEQVALVRGVNKLVEEHAKLQAAMRDNMKRKMIEVNIVGDDYVN